MRPWSVEPAGRFEEIAVESAALAGNPLGDPAERPLVVYLPPGYDESDRRYPSIYVIQGFTGQVDMWRNRRAFRATFPEALDELFARGQAPPCIVVFVDAWTSLGGSQFVDSPGTGRYHTYLCEDVVPFVDQRYRTMADREHRGIAGKSSGGFGAMITPILRPDLWGGLATHAGDALFELCYPPDFGPFARVVTRQYDGSVERFWEDFGSRPSDKPSDFTIINTWAMASCYSAEADGRVLLPFDIATAQLIPEVWDRWLAWDPVRMVPDHTDAVQSLRAVWIDAGRSDEYFLDLGAEAFRRALATAGVAEEVVHFELFDGKHGGTDWRYPLSLAFLAERLQ
ncbi:MAG: hypothetical protein QOG64_2495 [Acidimicrobiaceae bacterium]|nr:hypothetical protein [Acidimicrobiaceae bacterium]